MIADNITVFRSKLKPFRNFIRRNVHFCQKLGVGYKLSPCQKKIAKNSWKKVNERK